MSARISPEDLKRLAGLTGARFPDEDLEALADALAAYRAFVEPLLEADLPDADSALIFDPRWRG